MRAVLKKSAEKAATLSDGLALWPAVLLVLLGVSLSFGSFFALRAAEFSRAQAEFTGETDHWRMLFQQQLTHTIDGLGSVSALLESSEEVTRSEFRTFTGTIFAAHPEILSIEWLPKVTSEQRERFEARAQAEGLNGYFIKDFAEGRHFIAAPVRTEHYPIYYVEPFDSNREALGFDYAGRPRRSDVMVQARDAGELVAASGFEVMPQDPKSDDLNVIVFLPRYSAGPLPTNVAERRARIAGFIAITFRMDVVLRSVAHQFALSGLSFELRAGSHELFTLTSSEDSLAIDTHRESSLLPAFGLQSEVSLVLPKLQFQLLARATPAFDEAPDYGLAWVALVGGLAMTALAVGYLQSLRRQFAKREAFELERDRLFNLTPDLLCIAGLDGYFKQLSPAWERTLEYSREDLLSQPFLSFVHPDDVAETQKRLQELARGTDVIDFQNRYRHHDGTWRWLEWRCIAAPEQRLVYASARDVTTQRETITALEQTRRFAQRATEVMPDVLYIDDVIEHQNIFTNRQGTVALGLPENYFASSADAVQSLMHTEDLPRFLAHTEQIQLLHDGEIAEITYRMRHADGSWRWFHGRDTVFERDEDGRVRLSIGTATDITAIKDAEVTMRENQQRLDFVLSAADMGVWELNLDTGTMVWTEPLTRLLGLAPEHAPRSLEEFLELIHSDDREVERRKIDEAVRSQSAHQSEFRIDVGDGRARWMALLAMVLGGDASKSSRLLGLMRDIDKRKQAEAEHRRMEEQIRQSQKMEALGALAGGIAHDFNNILTAINGNARLALHDLASDDPIRTNLAEIHRGAKRATDLVSRILAFSRNEEPALRRLDLRPIVEEAIRLLRATMPAMIEIRFDASGPIPHVLADATQIHQVIMNLGANARDAMSAAGGVLTIAVNEVPKDGRPGVVAPEIRAQTCVRLTVEDTGIGISRENLSRIFEPFFTTKAPGHGTGMGLAMVHGIVRRHGGVILASSQLGRGTKFEIYFPSASAADAQEEVVTPAAVRGHGERILYVDDEEPLVFLASRMLTRLGFEVDGRTDPQQALREFERDPYRWDLVISDLGMPGMSGLDLAAAMQRIRPDVPLMLTSGYVRAEDAERARVLGTGDIIPKPNTVEEMTPIIFSRIAAAREEQRAQAQPNKTHSQN